MHFPLKCLHPTWTKKRQTPTFVFSPVFPVFPVFTVTVNGLRVKNETPLQGQVVLAEMNVILWGYNECDGI